MHFHTKLLMFMELCLNIITQKRERALSEAPFETLNQALFKALKHNRRTTYKLYACLWTSKCMNVPYEITLLSNSSVSQ